MKCTKCGHVVFRYPLIGRVPSNQVYPNSFERAQICKRCNTVNHHFTDEEIGEALHMFMTYRENLGKIIVP